MTFWISLWKIEVKQSIHPFFLFNLSLNFLQFHRRRTFQPLRKLLFQWPHPPCIPLVTKTYCSRSHKEARLRGRWSVTWRILSDVEGNILNYIRFFKVRGVPRSEVASQGRPPRILSDEEQEKARVSCRVRFVIFASLCTTPLNLM